MSSAAPTAADTPTDTATGLTLQAIHNDIAFIDTYAGTVLDMVVPNWTKRDIVEPMLHPFTEVITDIQSQNIDTDIREAMRIHHAHVFDDVKRIEADITIGFTHYEDHTIDHHLQKAKKAEKDLLNRIDSLITESLTKRATLLRTLAIKFAATSPSLQQALLTPNRTVQDIRAFWESRANRLIAYAFAATSIATTLSTLSVNNC